MSVRDRLDDYYHQIRQVILDRQHPITGLLPASTAITTHGDYTDAWVRDNVYSIMAAWGLAIAFRKHGAATGRTYELEHSVVKLMRGLLFSMMKQAAKVERFKETQDPLDALHAKYDTKTGDTVVGDDQWGHLQLDATSLFLLMLAQMTASGLQIIYTLDEVDFVQNLVHYIGRAYRTPDYGIWERGDKINHGNAELNASSVGMAKAALESMNGFNLFGIEGDSASVIYVLPDEIARSRDTLNSLLPRESSSKEVDAATLSVIGFPAFAVADRALADRTRKAIVDKLQGHYGCKRFLRDGHQTVLEDHSRLYYEPWELQQFSHIECEWPLFFTYLLLDSLFRGDADQVREYRDRLEFVQVKQNGLNLLPELYVVPAERIEAERANPNSQTRLPNENVPLVWAQSLWYLGQMMIDGLLSPGDLDPLGRHLHLQRQRDPVVQIALLVEDESLQLELADAGIAAQTLNQVDPVQVRPAAELIGVYHRIGHNDRLGLTGRPLRRLRSLTTSRLFSINNQVYAFLPSVLDVEQFYLTLDYHFLVAQIKAEIAYVHRHWSQMGQPIMTLLVTRSMLDRGREALLDLFAELKSGELKPDSKGESAGDGVRVRIAPLQQLMRTAAIERIDNLQGFSPSSEVPQMGPADRSPLLPGDHNEPLGPWDTLALVMATEVEPLIERLWASNNLYEQAKILQAIVRLESLSYLVVRQDGSLFSVSELLNAVYDRAGELRLWAVVRRSAALLEKIDVSLSDVVTDILVRRKQIAVGKAYSEASLITQPLANAELLERLKEFCREDIRDRVLTQEVLIYLSLLCKSEPELMLGFMTLRVGHLILLLTSELAREQELTQDDAFETLMQLSPFDIQRRLRQVLRGYDTMNQVLQRQESLHLRAAKTMTPIDWIVLAAPSDDTEETPVQDWRRKRQVDGALTRIPKDFYRSVWDLLHHCKGVVIGDKLERINRLESHPLILEMTPGETNFALRIEHLLNKIQAPEYRQMNIEALLELAAIAQGNPDLQIDDYLVLDVVVGHAVRLAWLDKHPNHQTDYDSYKGSAWSSFYQCPPQTCAGFVARSFQYLLESGDMVDV
jgi:phosphorylase kinase alpha/beta subunit